MKINSILGNT